MADLFGLSPADRETLMRMIARERANYTSDVRSLAPVPRPRVIYKPSQKFARMLLTGHLAATRSSSDVQSVIGRECEYVTEGYWKPIFPYVEHTIFAATNGVCGQQDDVVLCVPVDGGYELFAAPPLKPSVFEEGPGASYLIGATYGWESVTQSGAWGLGDTAGASHVSKSGWFGANDYWAGRSYTAIPQANLITWDGDADPAVDGSFVCGMNNTYRLTLEIGGLVSLVGSAGGSQRRQNTTTSTDAGGSPSHSHGYYYREYLDGTNPGFELQPVLWVKDGTDPIAVHAGAESSDVGFPAQSFSVFTQKGSGLIRWSYHNATVATLYDDSRFSIKITVPNLWLMRAEIDRWRLTVTPLFQHDGYFV